MNPGDMEAFQEIVDRSKRIVFFGGAGVSTASGIPDFRSADGLYAGEEEGLSPEAILSRSFFYLCMECNAPYPMEAILHSEEIPRCKDCGGVIRPNETLYGEPLPKYVCIGAIREITNADTLIVAGTSLAVEPAASFLGHFRGKHLVVLNRDPIPAEEQAELVIRGDVAEVMDRLRVS